MDNRIMQRIEPTIPTEPIQILEERIKPLITALNYHDKFGEPKAMTIGAHNHFLEVLERTINEIPDTPDDTVDTKNRLSKKVKELIKRYNDYRTEPVNTNTNMPVIPTVITDFLNTGGGRDILNHLEKNHENCCI